MEDNACLSTQMSIEDHYDDTSNISQNKSAGSNDDASEEGHNRVFENRSASPFEKEPGISYPFPIAADELDWNARFQLLKEVGEGRGAVLDFCNIPKGFSTTLYDGTIVNLGKWLCNQRNLRRGHALSQEREAQLQSLVDKGWLWWDKPDFFDDKAWNERFQLLQDVGEAFGESGAYCNIPQDFKIPGSDGKLINLGHWLGLQRQRRRQKKLDTEREEKLQSLVDKGWLWWDRPTNFRSMKINDAGWLNRLALLSQIGKDRGETGSFCNVPSHFDVLTAEGEVINLGAWLCNQRIFKRQGKLDPNREMELQVLVDRGWLWWDAPISETAHKKRRKNSLENTEYESMEQILKKYEANQTDPTVNVKLLKKK